MSTMHLGKHHFSRHLHTSGASARTPDFRARRPQSSSNGSGLAISPLARLGLVVVLTIVTLFEVLNGSEGISPTGVAIAVAMGALLVIILQWGCFPSQVQRHNLADAEPQHRQTHVTLNN